MYLFLYNAALVKKNVLYSEKESNIIRFLLEDEEKVQEYKEELEEYTRYEKQLIDILKKYVAGGAKFTWEN